MQYLACVKAWTLINAACRVEETYENRLKNYRVHQVYHHYTEDEMVHSKYHFPIAIVKRHLMVIGKGTIHDPWETQHSQKHNVVQKDHPCKDLLRCASQTFPHSI